MNSLVAGPLNPRAWNRNSYVYGNPANFTDSTGHFIDTLWDAVDLAVDVQNCLGDSDALSCYMVPVSAGFFLMPGLTGGFADNIVRQADGLPRGGVPDDVAARFAGSGPEDAWPVVRIDPETGVPPGYPREEFFARLEITEKYIEGQCAYCTLDMLETFRDETQSIFITSGEYLMDLWGPNPRMKDIGAPHGWHIVSVDSRGFVWDNFGFQGPLKPYIRGIQGANAAPEFYLFLTGKNQLLKHLDKFRVYNY